MNAPRYMWQTLLIIYLCASMGACTLIREGDDDNNATTNAENAENAVEFNAVFGPNGVSGPVDVPDDAPSVDALILIDLARSASELMGSYYRFLNLVEQALQQDHIFLRNVAVAPMYRQQSQAPLLLYGVGDPDNISHDLSQALDYYVSEQGLSHLDGRSESPGENLAALGMNLDQASIFNPQSASSQGRAYFEEAQDGFVVFHLTSTARECGHDDSACALNGQSPASYLTAAEADSGDASWLTLPGSTGLAPDEIVHVSVHTAEGVDYDAFMANCLDQPNFPSRYRDFIENSGDHEYFDPKANELRQRGGLAQPVDLCTAFSTRAESTARQVAGEITRVLD